MKLLKLFTAGTLLLSLFIPVLTLAQAKEEKFYYKDTIFEFNGSKVEVTKSLATVKYFKTTVTITNQSENFIIINPWEVSGFITGSADKYSAVSKRPIVIAPKYSKRFSLRFEGKDFREPNLSVDFNKLQVTQKVESVIEFNDIDPYKENYREVGPIKWTMLKKVHDPKNLTFEVTTEIQYSGSKFLGVFYNNITLVTKDGGKFVNAKRNGDFYYDKEKPMKRIGLVFPVDGERVKEENGPKLNFNSVFKEYSLGTMEGFKIRLRSGTLEDYKNKKSDAKDTDMEEMDKE